MQRLVLFSLKVSIRAMTEDGSQSITKRLGSANDGICDVRDLPTQEMTNGYHSIVNTTEALVEFVSDEVLETAGFKLIFTQFVSFPGTVCDHSALRTCLISNFDVRLGRRDFQYG